MRIVVVVAVVVVVLVVLVFVVADVVVGRKRRAQDSQRIFFLTPRARGSVGAAAPNASRGSARLRRVHLLGERGGPPHTTRTGECRTARVTGSCLRKRHWQHTA